MLGVFLTRSSLRCLFIMSRLVIVLKLHLCIVCMVLCEYAHATLCAEDIGQSLGASSSLSPDGTQRPNSCCRVWQQVPFFIR